MGNFGKCRGNKQATEVKSFPSIHFFMSRSAVILCYQVFVEGMIMKKQKGVEEH